MIDTDKTKYRGTFTENAPLGAQSWFRCGGTADQLFEPADLDDLAKFLKDYHGKLTILGGLANTIVRDGGIRGVTLQLGKPFATVTVMDDRYICAGAGALNGTIAAAAAKAGIGGLEFLSGIPGTLGGALAMNAGAYGAETKGVLIGAEAIDRRGKMHKFTVDDLQMSYRNTVLPDGMIFTSAILKGEQDDKAAVKTRLKYIKQKRQDTQPITEKTGGSTFRNPYPVELQNAKLPEGTSAWKVVEMVDGRGFSIGGAKMSEKHCNFMINTGDATAAHLEMLGDEMINRAYREFGLKLHWEIKRIGEKV